MASFDQKHKQMRVFMFHPRASVNIALGRDKPNHTLARYDNFYQHCCMKPVAEETFECDQNIHTETTALVKKIIPWKAKPHRAARNQRRDVFCTQKVGFDLFLDFKVTFCLDISSRTLLSYFLTPV